MHTDSGFIYPAYSAALYIRTSRFWVHYVPIMFFCRLCVSHFTCTHYSHRSATVQNNYLIAFILMYDSSSGIHCHPIYYMFSMFEAVAASASFFSMMRWTPSGGFVTCEVRLSESAIACSRWLSEINLRPSLRRLRSEMRGGGCNHIIARAGLLYVAQVWRVVEAWKIRRVSWSSEKPKNNITMRQSE